MKKKLMRAIAPFALAGAMVLGTAAAGNAGPAMNWDYKYSVLYNNGIRGFHYQASDGTYLIGVGYVGESFYGTEEQLAEAIADGFVPEPSPGDNGGSDGSGGSGGGGGGGGAGGGGGGGGPIGGGTGGGGNNGNVNVGEPETVLE
ncbi:hypothetical protein [Phytoactinopolyspora endophytica]|uniref:hypothetical protein n=1 Tax=Phytoactinopolyspora endophytica TaxID=1642495 RepID=UPI00101BE943|nr:hypothetical protein [Phytoactinopolyspora endophytica]